MDPQFPPGQHVVVSNIESVTVHTFVSAPAFLANATHIIETQNSVVVVDGQFIKPYATQFRDLVNSLNKPIARVYLSHEHPDHWFGLGAAFMDTEIHALPETTNFLKDAGESVRASLAAAYGSLVTDDVPMPIRTVSPGIEEIDGLRYIHEKVTDAESDNLLTIKLPDLGIHIVQDLLYSGSHPYLTHSLEHWVEVLQGLLDSEYDTFLPGHGLPANKEEVQANISYLQTAHDLLAKGATAASLKTDLLAAFPERTGSAVFDIYLPRLFAGT